MRSLMLLSCMVLLASAAQATPTGETFLMNVPGITGEVTRPSYVGWISVNSFSGGFRNSSVVGSGGTVPSCQPLVVVKPLDQASPLLTAAVATFHVYPYIELVGLGGTGNPFVRLLLLDVAISSVDFGGSQTASAQVDNLKLAPRRIEITFQPQKPDGTLGNAATATIDCLF